ncbi:hypothetical protein [Okeania sp. SIO2B3]|uniref:hypothetical protein n=1 Tax=Okeania sp. SIO2B3 TaxID=2607784 RepID=UPI0013C1C669|nr:hypothetical protein [Okeania sp. SIO2B3]NET44914.1 hypothetical protein [Okeania sp. SIO2B3]
MPNFHDTAKFYKFLYRSKYSHKINLFPPAPIKPILPNLEGRRKREEGRRKRQQD